MASPKQVHWDLGRNVLRYLKGTIDFSLHYTKVDKMELIGYAGADWNNTLDSRSISGYCYFLAHNSSPISWKTRKLDAEI